MSKNVQFERRTVCQMFQWQAEQTPEQIALIHNDLQLTYRQLDGRANFLAQALISRGCQPGDVIALAMPRSVAMIVAMLAILKAGAAYLPIDEQEPVSRQQFKLEAAGVKQLVGAVACSYFPVSASILQATEPQLFCSIAESPTVDISAEYKAYVMFTSGSTGLPKGVLVPHRGIVRLVCQTNYIEISPNDRILQFAPATFDASTFEIWGALLNGATLVLYSASTLDPNVLKADVQQHQVSVLWLTAALFHLIAGSFIQTLASLRVLLAGGDVLNAQYVNKVLQTFPQIILINGYGPTENTTFTCCHCMTVANIPLQQVPIGLPVRGSAVHVLDAERRPVPAGEPGELYTSGAGVALGYLTPSSDSFFYDTAIAPGLIYRTGDLVWQDSQGVVHFIGRHDSQVKVRGYRVSLDEIKTSILKLAGVRDVLVTTEHFSEGEQLLVAILMMEAGTERPVRHIQLELAALLPTYMIPDKIVMNAALPINKNGKIDRKSIPLPQRLSED